MLSMSINPCEMSRYTVPRMFSGMKSWTIRALTITRSPTVMVPDFTPTAAIIIIETTPTAATTRCPVLRIERDVCVTMDDGRISPSRRRTAVPRELGVEYVTVRSSEQSMALDFARCRIRSSPSGDCASACEQG